MTITEKERSYLKAMTESCFNDNGDDYKTHGIYCFSVTDEIKDYTAQQAKGVMSSLIKKGLITIFDCEGRGQANDMVVTMTAEGVIAFDPCHDCNEPTCSACSSSNHSHPAGI